VVTVQEYLYLGLALSRLGPQISTFGLAVAHFSARQVGGHVIIGAWLIWRFRSWWFDLTGVVLLGQGFSAGGSEFIESPDESIARPSLEGHAWH
jgi:hypothetical protein